MQEEDEKLFVEAQESVVKGLQKSALVVGASNADGDNGDDDAGQQQQQQQQQQQKIFDVMNPSEFSRESIMFVRYAVDCCGIQVFDLSPAEVQKLWLQFCIQFNTGNELTPDWYEMTAYRTDEEQHQQQQQQHQRLIRLDATTWPSMDQTTSHFWDLKLTDAQLQQCSDASRLSTKLAQSNWRMFFQKPEYYGGGGGGGGMS